MPPTPVILLHSQVFETPPLDPDPPYMAYEPTPGKVDYFIGRNGSGKSKLARLLAGQLEGRYLATDRLLGIMSTTNYGWGMVPSPYKGPPIDENRSMIASQSRATGTATDVMLKLREDPVVGLKVAAFMKKALGRTIQFRESAGFFDPFVLHQGVEYSLLRDEGHGLRELTILLAATYSTDWQVLIVDEPELHLHPALAQLWASELSRECVERNLHAVVVTHEPTMVRPANAADLKHTWLFQPGATPVRLSSLIHPGTEGRITASLRKNPQLVSQVAFAPRPVLVEGAHDVAALSTALVRSQAAAVVSQTEFVACGSSGDVVLWFEICRKARLNSRAIADLDAIFSSDVQRTTDRSETIVASLRSELHAEPAAMNVALKPLLEAANRDGVEKNEKARALWLARDVDPESGHARRRDVLLSMLRDEGLWLHPEGTLEDVLGIIKGQADPSAAAASPGRIDIVAGWAAYDLDPLGDLEHLLRASVERIANNLTQALGSDPSAVFARPVGSTAKSDAKLVDVQAVGDERYRITIKAPKDYVGFYAEVDRHTPPSDIVLVAPERESGAAAPSLESAT